MDIIKNKRKSICCACIKKIDSKYKVKDKGNTFHMNCYKPWVESAIIRGEARIKKLKVFLRLFKQHHKEMIIEALEKDSKYKKSNNGN